MIQTMITYGQAHLYLKQKKASTAASIEGAPIMDKKAASPYKYC